MFGTKLASIQYSQKEEGPDKKTGIQDTDRCDKRKREKNLDIFYFDS